MKTTTELIDELNRAERGDRVTVETDAGEYEGLVEATHFAAPEGTEEGVVGIDVRIDTGEFDGELLEISSTASSRTEKFSPPVVRFPESGQDERAILDVRLSDT